MAIGGRPYQLHVHWDRHLRVADRLVCESQNRMLARRTDRPMDHRVNLVVRVALVTDPFYDECSVHELEN